MAAEWQRRPRGSAPDTVTDRAYAEPPARSQSRRIDEQHPVFVGEFPGQGVLTVHLAMPGRGTEFHHPTRTLGAAVLLHHGPPTAPPPRKGVVARSVHHRS